MIKITKRDIKEFHNFINSETLIEFLQNRLYNGHVIELIYQALEDKDNELQSWFKGDKNNGLYGK